MPFIIPIGVAVGGAAGLAYSLFSDWKTKAKLPPSILALLEQAESTGDYSLVLRAAEVATTEGLSSLSAALLRRHEGLRLESDKEVYESPLKGVDSIKWTKFVNQSKSPGPRTVSPSFHFGLFFMGVRRLADMGLMRDPKQIDFQGRRVWTGEWIAPWSLRRFLADTAEQYRVFCLSMVDYAARFPFPQAGSYPR